MNSQNNSTLVPKVIKLALMISALIYFYVAWSQNGKTIGVFNLSEFMADPMNIMLAVFSIIMIVAGKIIPNKFRNQQFNNTESSTNNTHPKNTYFTAMIVELAIYESVAIYGLIIAMTSKVTIHMLPFLIVSLFLMSSVSTKMAKHLT